MKIIFRKQIVLLLLITGSAITFLIWGHTGEKRLNAASSSFTELYNDRLVAEHLVYQMTELIHKKQLLISDRITEGDQKQMAALSMELTLLTNQFAASKLSQKEKIVFDRLKLKLQHIKNSDRQLSGNSAGANTLALQYSNALSLLAQLAEIQINEGTKLSEQGQVALSSSAMGLKLQSVLFVIFILGLLALLKSVWIKGKVIQRHELN